VSQSRANPAEGAGIPVRPFVMKRVFDAPRDLVWKAWSEPERLAQWWGPKECELRVASLDFRPGGVFHYAMDWPDGRTMWAHFVYREIVTPEKIVFVNSFSDEHRNVTRCPFSQTWPLEVLNSVTLSERDGRTDLALHVIPLNPTDEERDTFESWSASLGQGYGGTFDKLAEHLARA
jgi:uncharacterized protein YndB with AHSA1/START domain